MSTAEPYPENPDNEDYQMVEYNQTVEQWLKQYNETEKAMGSVISEKKGGRGFEMAPEGVHIGVCEMIVNLGVQETYYGPKNQHYIRWQLVNEFVEYEKDGETLKAPMVIGKTYTSSLNEKANLRKDLESWRGRPFTDDELQGFDLENVLGKPCQVQIVHVGRDGKSYANVTRVMALPKGAAVPELQGDPVLYDASTNTGSVDQLPEWLQKKVSDQLAAPNEPEDEEPFDDEIPFAWAVVFPIGLIGWVLQYV